MDTILHQIDTVEDCSANEYDIYFPNIKPFSYENNLKSAMNVLYKNRNSEDIILFWKMLGKKSTLDKILCSNNFSGVTDAQLSIYRFSRFMPVSDYKWIKQKYFNGYNHIHIIEFIYGLIENVQIVLYYMEEIKKKIHRPMDSYMDSGNVIS